MSNTHSNIRSLRSAQQQYIENSAYNTAAINNAYGQLMSARFKSLDACTQALAAFHQPYSIEMHIRKSEPSATGDYTARHEMYCSHGFAQKRKNIRYTTDIVDEKLPEHNTACPVDVYIRGTIHGSASEAEYRIMDGSHLHPKYHNHDIMTAPELCLSFTDFTSKHLSFLQNWVDKCPSFQLKGRFEEEFKFSGIEDKLWQNTLHRVREMKGLYNPGEDLKALHDRLKTMM